MIEGDAAISPGVHTLVARKTPRVFLPPVDLLSLAWCGPCLMSCKCVRLGGACGERRTMPEA